MKLVSLTPETLQAYINRYYSTLDREASLDYILDNYAGSITYINKTSMLSESAYIIAYYENSHGVVVKVTPNYVYINNTLHSATLIYDQDIMFIDDYTEDDIVRDIPNGQYTVSIDTSKMTTVSVCSVPTKASVIVCS